MKRIPSIFKFFIVSLFFLFTFNSCQFFENDVSDFMEKYTETAAIEEYKINVTTYKDASSQLCLASDEDTEFVLYMRNPKKFTIQPSVLFNQLDASYNRSEVTIRQEDFATVKLKMPQKFLIPVDEGKNISATINLHEPMSGRDFERYTISLSCNTKPPLILNPTILNHNNQNFVIAFDMPNEEEVAIRHKDLAYVEINGVDYPVEVTTGLPATIDSENPDVLVAHYNFPDSHFKRTYDSSYIAIGGKTFDHNANNSVYFESDDPFFAGDKEYKIILKDRAGLTSEVKASTMVSKLNKPVIKDQNGYPIAEGVIAAVPYDEDTEKGVITIEPPTADHLGNPVSGTTVHYRVYEATGTGLIYTSGTTTTAKTIELPQNTYRVEAYATLTNYENSATNTVKFRFMNNVLFVRACQNFPNDFDGRNRSGADGSEAAPYTTIQEALDDINNTTDRPEKASTFTILVEGDFTSQTVNMQSTSDNWGEITLSGDYWTDELIIKKNPRPVNPSGTTKLKSITLEDTLNPNFGVTIGNVTITNADGNGITKESENTLIIDGATITGCDSSGIEASPVSGGTGGTVTVKSGTISYNNLGISGTNCVLNVQGGIISNNTAHGLCYGCDSGVTCTISGGTITQNGYNQGNTAEAAVCIDAGTCTITGGSITNNYGCGIYTCYGSTIYLYGGSITENHRGGISLDSTDSIHVKNNPYVQSNTTGATPVTSNVNLLEDKTITIDGPFTAGARIGVTTHTNNEPTQIGYTYSFATGYVNSGSPSQYFTSDRGFSIVGGSGGAVSIAKSGASGNTNYNANDFTFDFAITDALGNTGTDFYSGFYPGVAKTFVISPAVTRKEPGGGTTALTYNSTDKKLYDASDIVQGNGEAVSWAVELYNGSTLIKTYTAGEINASSAGIAIGVNQSFIGTYTLKVNATYLGLEHGASYTLDCSKNADNLSYRIKALTASPASAIEIDGELGATELGKVKAALTSLYTNHPAVRVSIDATNTSCANPTSLNAGHYFEGCNSLSSMILPEWMMRLPPDLFKNCANLTSITIPDTVIYIIAGAFAGCTSLTEINYEGTKAQWMQVERVYGWHTGVPATQVHCLATNEYCPLDWGGVNVPGTAWSPVSGSAVFISGRSYTFSNLWVSDHETTQAEYTGIMGTNPSLYAGNDEFPVEQVSWYEALVYCNKRSIAENLTPCYTIGGSTDPDDWGPVPTSSNATWNAVTCNFAASSHSGYRLPSEAEWEYLARGGDLTGTQYTYSGSNTIENVAWYGTNANGVTHEVCQKAANKLGLFDMTGNVWEWCWDFYNVINASTAATGPSSSSSGDDNEYRVLRGGGCDYAAFTVSDRTLKSPTDKAGRYGFRVVRSIPSE